MKISDEAAEAAAAAAYDLTHWTQWVQLSVGLKRELMVPARAALEAAAPYMLKNMRRMTEVELARRDRPEAMVAARQRLQQERREGRAEMIRAVKEVAWDDGAMAMGMQTGDSMSDDMIAVLRENPYRSRSSQLWYYEADPDQHCELISWVGEEVTLRPVDGSPEFTTNGSFVGRVRETE